MKWAFILTLISTQTFASIFGIDHRVNTTETDSTTQELARSVPALVLNKQIRKVGKDQFLLQGRPLTELNMCLDESFSDESLIANCSGSLIAPNKVLTAAHCLDSVGYGCEDYRVVFDYQDNGSNDYLLGADQVYQCKKILHFEFDLTLRGLDLAVIELDREVVNRTPVTLSQRIAVGDKLSMIGYPLGISQKVVTSGNVLSYDVANSSFHTDLDSFSVNSGGPIFNEAGEQVGVLVRGTGLNLDQYNGESCYRWHRAKSSTEFSAANDIRSILTHSSNDKE